MPSTTCKWTVKYILSGTTTVVATKTGTYGWTPATSTSSVTLTSTDIAAALYSSTSTVSRTEHAYFFEDDNSTELTSGQIDYTGNVTLRYTTTAMSSAATKAQLYSSTGLSVVWMKTITASTLDMGTMYAKVTLTRTPANFSFTYPTYSAISSGKTGYTFSSWKCFGGKGTNVNYTASWPGNHAEGSSDYWSTAYNNLGPEFGAVMTANTYTVKFNSNGGTGAMSDLSCTYDTTTTLTRNRFAMSGYNFAGWATSSSATEADYTDGQAVLNLTAIDGDTVNLYAVWSEKPVPVPGVHENKITIGKNTTDYTEGTTISMSIGGTASNSEDLFECKVKSKYRVANSLRDSYGTGTGSMFSDSSYPTTWDPTAKVYLDDYIIDYGTKEEYTNQTGYFSTNTTKATRTSTVSWTTRYIWRKWASGIVDIFANITCPGYNMWSEYGNEVHTTINYGDKYYHRVHISNPIPLPITLTKVYYSNCFSRYANTNSWAQGGSLQDNPAWVISEIDVGLTEITNIEGCQVNNTTTTSGSSRYDDIDWCVQIVGRYK